MCLAYLRDQSLRRTARFQPRSKTLLRSTQLFVIFFIFYFFKNLNYLFIYFRALSEGGKTLYLIDSRPMANAMYNTIAGRGFETAELYPKKKEREGK